MKVTEVATRPLTQDLLSHDVSSTDQIKDVCTVYYGQVKMDVNVQNLLWSFYNLHSTHTLNSCGEGKLVNLLMV